MMTGGSVILAFLAGASWICLVLYCCYEFYTGYYRLKLRTDMRDIHGFYLSNPDNCFWVAEAEVNGRSQIIGIVAVEGKKLPGNNNQKYGELFRMIVSSAGRRKGLGSQLVKTVMDFCKNSGFSKIVLETSSTQKAAIALYVKMGFTILKTPCIVSVWVSMLTRITVFRMEKLL